MGRRTAFLLAAVLCFYLVLVAQRGVLLVASGSPVGVALGLAVLVLPLLGGVLLVGELRLGAGAQRLAQRVATEGQQTAQEADPEVAFDRARDRVRARPDDWVAWFELAQAYGEARDTSRGRQALRRALALERAGRTLPGGVEDSSH